MGVCCPVPDPDETIEDRYGSPEALQLHITYVLYKELPVGPTLNFHKYMEEMPAFASAVCHLTLIIYSNHRLLISFLISTGFISMLGGPFCYDQHAAGFRRHHI